MALTETTKTALLDAGFTQSAPDNSGTYFLVA